MQPKPKWAKPLAKDSHHVVTDDGALIMRVDIVDAGVKQATVEVRIDDKRDISFELQMEPGVPPITFNGGAWVKES